MATSWDVVVVGGGTVGLATAFRLLQARPELRVALIEREDRVGAGQSSRNTGVLHEGMYYPPAKARWCREAKAALERFCVAHGVPLSRNGKVVVAVEKGELPALRALAVQAHANGCRIEELDAAGLREREPHVAGIAGLWTPETAVTDFARVCEALASRVSAAGGAIKLRTELVGLTERRDEVRLETTAGDLAARVVVACAGLRSDRVASMTGAVGRERIVPFRASWFELSAERAHLVTGNIYPVPRGDLPYIGVHLTRRIDGRVWIGPNIMLARARQGHGGGSASVRDPMALLRFSGTWRLAARHLGIGATQLWRELIPRATVRQVRRYLPEVTVNDVERGPMGIRAQAIRRDGTFVDGPVLRGSGRVVHVLNPPAPAATACLEIGANLRDHALARFSR